MLIWVIYLKTKLISGKRLSFIKYLYKPLCNTFKHFGKSWKNRNSSEVFNILFFIFFKNWNKFCDFKFFNKNCFFKRSLKNEHYEIVDINNNNTAKRWGRRCIATILFPFSALNCFLNYASSKHCIKANIHVHIWQLLESSSQVQCLRKWTIC